jgi:hypothetical protein
MRLYHSRLLKECCVEGMLCFVQVWQVLSPFVLVLFGG